MLECAIQQGHIFL